MRMAVAATALGLTLLAAGALAACSPDEPVEPPDPVPSRTPVFASEDEALAAAEAAYAAYLEVADEIAADSGEKPDRIDDVAFGQLAQDAKDGFAQLRDNRWRTIGTSALDAFLEQSVDVNTSAVVA